MNQIELFKSNGFWHAYYRCDGIREVIQTPFSQDVSFEFVCEKIQSRNQGVNITHRKEFPNEVMEVERLLHLHSTI